jgi:FixJ family two-component response regulator
MRRLPLPAPPHDHAAPSSDASARCVCHVALRDPELRAAVRDELRSKGWQVVEHAGTFDLLAALSDCILGTKPWPPADLIVVDETSPACRGTTIAQGLRELGVAIPVLVVEGDRVIYETRPGWSSS